MISVTDSENRPAGGSPLRFWSRRSLCCSEAAVTTVSKREEAWTGPGAEWNDTVELRFGDLYAKDLQAKCTIHCVAGALWITSQERRCDYILHVGESLVLRRSGKIVVSTGGSDRAVMEIRVDCS